MKYFYISFAISYLLAMSNFSHAQVFTGSFDGTCFTEEWKATWGMPWTQRVSADNIVDSDLDSGKALRIVYPKGSVGPGEGGAQFPMVFEQMKGINDGHFKELYLRYYVKFEEGFDFRLGGKLPGLMGGGDSWMRSGGNQPNGTNGWTLRFMWREGGKLVVYAYVPKSGNGKWGASKWGQDIECEVTATTDKWYCIEQYVNVGMPGKDDGQLKVWIDGIQRLNISDMRFWNEENDFGKIGGIYFSTFHGGNTPEWGPHQNAYAQFDAFAVDTVRVGKIK